jgi:hypothetical protein
MEAGYQVLKVKSCPDAGKPKRLERRRWMFIKNRVKWTENETRKLEQTPLKRCVTLMA